MSPWRSKDWKGLPLEERRRACDDAAAALKSDIESLRGQIQDAERDLDEIDAELAELNAEESMGEELYAASRDPRQGGLPWAPRPVRS